MQHVPGEKGLPIPEAARRLNVTTTAIYKAIDTGRLTVVRTEQIGKQRRRYVSEADVERMKRSDDNV